MPLIFYTGERGRKPPQHQVVEIVFEEPEVALGGEVLLRSMPDTLLETCGGRPAFDLLRMLGAVLSNHSIARPEAGASVRGNDLNLVEWALLKGMGPANESPIPKGGNVYVPISREEFAVRSQSEAPDIMIDPETIRHLTLDTNHVY